MAELFSRACLTVPLLIEVPATQVKSDEKLTEYAYSVNDRLRLKRQQRCDPAPRWCITDSSFACHWHCLGEALVSYFIGPISCSCTRILDTPSLQLSPCKPVLLKACIDFFPTSRTEYSVRNFFSVRNFSFSVRRCWWIRLV